MDPKIEKVLHMWHKRYEDEAYQYTEFESSDIEYFVGCMLYNHFDFSKAVPTMKTIDLSYDFLSTCGDEEYEQAKSLIESIKFEEEQQAVEFLLSYLEEASKKYNSFELYLLNRLQKHVTLLLERYEQGVKADHVDFQAIYSRK